MLPATATSGAPRRTDRRRRLAARRAARAAARRGGRGRRRRPPGFPDYDGAARRRLRPATAELDPAPAGRRWRRRSRCAGAAAWRRTGSGRPARRRSRASAGGGGAERVTDAFMKVICARRRRSGYASRTAVAVGALDPARWPSGPRCKAARGEPAELEPGEYPVVLEPQAVGGCSTCWATPPSTAWRTRRAAARWPAGSATRGGAGDQPVRLAALRAHAAARVRRGGHAQGAAAADPGRRGARGGARRPQRRARAARARPVTRWRRAAIPPAPSPRTSCSRAAAPPTWTSCARRSSAAST